MSESDSSFKKMFAADVRSTFLDPNVFAERHLINGKEVCCLVDKDLTLDEELSRLFGVFTNRVTVYMAEGEIPVPKVGSMFSIDRSLHLVTRAYIEDGILVVIAEESKS